MTPYEHLVQYYETDSMRVVHHSNYIRWFEEARVDFMERLGYPYSRMEQEGIFSPVVGVECRYRSPVRFEQRVKVTVRVQQLSHAKLEVAYEVRDSKTNELRATGATQHCFLNGDGRPVSLKKANPEFFAILDEQRMLAPTESDTEEQ